MTGDAPTDERLDELESKVERQQRGLADQRATIAAQRDRIERLEDEREITERNEAADDEDGDGAGVPWPLLVVIALLAVIGAIAAHRRRE